MLEEMVETFNDAYQKDRERQDTGFRLFDGKEATAAGLLAVFDKHVKAMVAEAWLEGRLHRVAVHIGEANPDTVYAERVISELKGK